MQKINAFKQLRRKAGMTQEQFGLFFDIPRRTIENWDNENDRRNCPNYLLKLMEYKLINEGLIKDDTPLLIEKK